MFSEGSEALLIQLQVLRIKTRFLARKLEPTSHVSHSATDLFQLIISNTDHYTKASTNKITWMEPKPTVSQVRFISVFSGQFSRSRRYDSIIDRGSKIPPTRILSKHMLRSCSEKKNLTRISDALTLQGQIPQLVLYPSFCGELWQSINPGSINDPILFYWKCTLTFQGNPVIWQKTAFIILKYSSRFFPAASPKLMFWIGDLEF